MARGSQFENPYASPGEAVQASRLATPQLPRSLRAFFWLHVVLTASPYACLIVTLPLGRGVSVRGFEMLAAISFYSIPFMACGALWFGLKYGMQIGWRSVVFGILEFILLMIQFFIAAPLLQ